MSLNVGYNVRLFCSVTLYMSHVRGLVIRYHSCHLRHITVLFRLYKWTINDRLRISRHKHANMKINAKCRHLQEVIILTADLPSNYYHCYHIWPIMQYSAVGCDKRVDSACSAKLRLEDGEVLSLLQALAIISCQSLWWLLLQIQKHLDKVSPADPDLHDGWVRGCSANTCTV